MIPKDLGYYLLKKLENMNEGLLVEERRYIYNDNLEVTYIYKNEEDMLKHKKEMEDKGYKTYKCGTKYWFRGDEITDPNSNFFKYDVRIPTAIYGKTVDGLIAEARKYYLSNDKEDDLCY